ncbi:MAG TPA: VWA domain-containing protein [Candidatus Binataceae bacterium]|nr:VWA domain-containing protein [Candidatus Binataceae bacterium]
MADSAPQSVLSLHEVKGVVTKFMRMLFPLEFRVDSLTNSAVMLPFHYPLMAGEMIYLPERIDTLDGDKQTHDYFFAVAAHLASRHEFGTFDLKLSDIPGFDERGEKGAEAIDCFVASFEDPGLGGALMRLCESARIDSELRRRYRGLAPRVESLNLALINRLSPISLSTILVRASLGLVSPDEQEIGGFAAQASVFFAPLHDAGSSVLDSTRQAGELYKWIQELIKAAREAGEGNPLEGADQVRNDLISAVKGSGGDSAGEGEDSGDSEADGGEPDQNVNLKTSGKSGKSGTSRALSLEELKKLLEQGAQIDPSQSSGEADGEGMYLTQLTGKQASELEQMREQLGEIGAVTGHGRLVMSRTRQDSYYAYDEWDYVLAEYRRNWCRLREVELSGDDGDFYANTLQRYSEMLPVIRRQFQRIRPASFRMVRGLEDGDEIDVDRAIEMRVSRMMGEVPDGRVYSARKKESRDVATLFLLDMSASTDEPIHREPRKFSDDDNTDDDWMKAWQRRPQQSQRPRRIIDVNKEALIIMAQALEEIGDAYAIMGFSGHGRDNVEFYVIKEFDNELSDEVKCRIGSIEPKRSTRMGAAIRHVREKFKDVSSRSKHMILLSDGFPQDFDYGHDRRSNAYGIQDTMVALKELEMAGVLPFCITVDKTGHDYLRQMCQSSRYLVIEDIASLPMQLPKVYEQVIRW